MNLVIRGIVVYWDVWVSASNLRLLMRHLGGQIIKMNSIINTHCYHADNNGSCWVLRVLCKSVVIPPLVESLRSCVQGFDPERKQVCNAGRGKKHATCYSAAGCDLTNVILVVEVVLAIRSVGFQLWLGRFRMNTFLLWHLPEWMAQHRVCKNHQCKEYMTVFVVDHRFINCISIVITVIRSMIKFDVDEPWYCISPQVKWTLAMRYQLATLSALDLDLVHHLPHALLPEQDTYCLPDGTQSIANALWPIQSGEYHNALQCCPFLTE